MANVVTTQAATSVTSSYALANGTIVSLTGVCTRRGFEYGLTQIPANLVYTDGSFSTGAFSLTIGGLQNETTYYARAFIVVATVTYYGDWVSFTTASSGYQIIIGGLDRTADVLAQTLKITDEINEKVNSCAFRMVDLSALGAPADEVEVIIIKDSVRIFGGYATNVSPGRQKAGGLVDYQITCSDYTRDLDRFLVAKTYASQTDKAIIEDIINTYCSGLGITTSNVVEGVTIDSIAFNYVTPSAAIQKIAQLTGRYWYLDYNKDIHYFTIGATAAPFDLTEAQSNQYNGLELSRDSSNIKNRVYVRGGTELSDNYTESVKADGVQRQFMLSEKPHDLTMTEGAVSKTVGIKNIDDPAAYDYLMNFQEKYVECGTNTTTPAAGTTMAFTFKYEIPILVSVEDNDSIQERGAYEFLVTDKDISTTQAARDRASAELTDYANSIVDGSFETIVDGFKSGQALTVNPTNYGVNDTYIVQKVVMRSVGAGTFFYTVQVASAKTLGIIRFLIAMLEGNKNKMALDEDEVVDELFSIGDSLDSLQDSLVIDSFSPYSQWASDGYDANPNHMKWDQFQWM